MLLGVVGDPILHSLSPELHREAFAFHKIKGAYVRILPESINSAINFAREVGIQGLNITAPYKEKVCSLINEASEDVLRLNACNTLLFSDETIFGENTDPLGIVTALKEGGVTLQGARALVLGYGGAGKAAVYALKNGGSEVIALTRSGKDAEQLTLETLEREIRIATILISTIPPIDIVPKELIRKDHIVLDANYSSESPLVRNAKEVGARVILGKDWLLYQACKSSELFLGKKTPIETLRKVVKTKRRGYPSRVALIGMMGSGKTSTGKELSHVLQKPFVDSDEEIERTLKTNISDIFKRDGEEKFREIEKRIVFDAIENGAKIISLGGGAALDTDTFKLLSEEFFCIWLWAATDVCLDRIGKERPLKDKFSDLLKARAYHYAELSNLVVVDGMNSSKAIADKIAGEIKRSGLECQ